MAALLRTRARLAIRLRPPVRSTTRFNRKGVTSWPVIPLFARSARASSMTAPISEAGISSVSGIGLAMLMPVMSPS